MGTYRSLAREPIAIARLEDLNKGALIAGVVADRLAQQTDVRLQGTACCGEPAVGAPSPSVVPS
jgi:hypothetical protein